LIEIAKRLLLNWALCWEPRSFGSTQRLLFGYQQLMHKKCGQPDAPAMRLNSLALKDGRHAGVAYLKHFLNHSLFGVYHLRHRIPAVNGELANA
jgi:hypothetical protein